MRAAGDPALPAGESHAAASPRGRKEVAESRLFYFISFLVFRIRTQLIRIRIQHFGLNTDPDPDPGFDDQKFERKLQLNKILNTFWNKN